MATSNEPGSTLTVAAALLEDRLQTLENNVSHCQKAAAVTAAKLVETKLQLKDSQTRVARLETIVEELQDRYNTLQFWFKSLSF